MSRIYAHRGFSGKYPENTMLAFEKAIEAGAEGIEFDVHLIKDDSLVIMHDETIDRTTDGKGCIKDYTFDELQKFDASAGFKGVYGENRIPKLRDYFELVKDIPDFMTNIEMKTGRFEYPTIEEKVIAMIEEYNLQDKIIISSFNHYTVMRCRSINPEIKTGYLTGDWIYNFGAYTKEREVECCHPWYGSLTDEAVAEMKANGRIINTWTVNEYDDIKHLADIGIDGLIGNYPDRMVELLRV